MVSLRGKSSSCHTLTTIKIILRCPGVFILKPEIITQLIGFTLNNFTVLGQVPTKVKPSKLKEGVVKGLKVL